MSTVVKLTKVLSKNFTFEQIGGIAVGLKCLTRGLEELNYAYEKDQQMLCCDQEILQVQLLITTLEGKQIGVADSPEGLNFVVQDPGCAETIRALKKIRQRYSKYALLHELEGRGYAKIKEERLPNGKIRMIVERAA